MTETKLHPQAQMIFCSELHAQQLQNPMRQKPSDLDGTRQKTSDNNFC